MINNCKENYLNRQRSIFSFIDLKTVTIPDSVTSIESGAFNHCASLAGITIPNNCTSLEWIVLSNNITSVQYGLFYNCSSLKNITIPNGVTSIKGSAFQNCSTLVSVTIPDTVTAIGTSAFSNCINLNFEIYDNAKYLNKWLIETENNSISSVDNAFSNNISL